MARALVVARAYQENDPRYKYIKDSRKPLQREKAFELHEAAKVPLGPCGLNEVALFQQHLTDYQIVIISGDHNNSIIYPPPDEATGEKPHLTLYLHNNHFDVINSVPGSWDVVIFVPGVLNPMIILPTTYVLPCVDRVEGLAVL